jgi:hypothetical protein
MNNAETAKLLARLSALWPQSQLAIPEGSAAAWAEVLADHEFESILIAARELATEIRFFPSLAELIERAEEIAGVGWLVAWRAVLAVVEKSNAPEWAALPDDTRRAAKDAVRLMGGFETLRDLKTADLMKQRSEFRQHFRNAERQIAAAKPTTANALTAENFGQIRYENGWAYVPLDNRGAEEVRAMTDEEKRLHPEAVPEPRLKKLDLSPKLPGESTNDYTMRVHGLTFHEFLEKTSANIRAESQREGESAA